MVLNREDLSYPQFIWKFTKDLIFDIFLDLGWICVDMGGYEWIWVDMGGYGWI